MGIDVLSCSRCASRWKPIGPITEPKVSEKILVHVTLPLRPERLHDGMTIVYDVTGEPVFDELSSAESQDDGWATARGPPGTWNGVEAPSPCELRARGTTCERLRWTSWREGVSFWT